MSKFLENIKYQLANIPGWRTDRKIVVIESDDWGSVRSTTKEAINSLKNSGINVDGCQYMKYDALESEEDLEVLFSVLSKVKDRNGNHPVFTANILVANPDFNKIKKTNFNTYYSESVVDSFRNTPGCENSFSLWKEGLKNKIFFPQSHGREHLNVARWMNDLMLNNKETRIAFDLGIFGLSAHIVQFKRASYLAALDLGIKNIEYDRKKIVIEALTEFEKLLGYKSYSFIAPNYVWDLVIEETLFQCGVECIQSAYKQNVSRYYEDRPKNISHYTGETNQYKQIYLMRNVYFEPSESPSKNWVGLALRQIQTAFFWKKPAIISSHRVNFIGSINEINRTTNAKLLEELLAAIIKKWPDVEFMTSAQLGSLIKSN